MGKRVELLAPCGSYESFLAAVNAGADAVYLGGREFGARAYAENFSEEELVSVIRQAHLFGVRVYLTVNTLVKEREFSRIYGYIQPLYEAGLDGVIVQDTGVLGFLKKHFPDLKFHASTQMTITGIYGASYLKKAGCERIVPARELSLEEIRFIKEKVPVEIEAFIHGAMCYCYSGQCLMSSVIGGRSGNRGRCAQPCRLPYRTAGKDGYFLSLKDMNTLEHIPELIEAGIDSFKIEGRMKKPEYVAGVVSVYRKYIDKYYGCVSAKGSTNDKKEADQKNVKNIKNISNEADKGENIRAYGSRWKIDQSDKRLLADLYIRSEAGSGYYFRGRGQEMLTLQKPGYNDADPALLKDLRETYIRELPKKAVNIRMKCRAGEPLYIEGRLSDSLSDSSSDSREKAEICVSVSGPAAENAEKRSVSEEEIRGQLVKTGGTPFTVEKCEVELGDNTFVPVKWIKQLRRELLQKIYTAYGARDAAEPPKNGDQQKCQTVEAQGYKGHGKNPEDRPEGDEPQEKPEAGGWERCQKPKSGWEEYKDPESETAACDLKIMIQAREQFEAVISVMERAEEKRTAAAEPVAGHAVSAVEKAEDGKAADIKETLVIDADLLLEDAAIRDRLYSKKVNWGIKCPAILRKGDEAFLKRLRAVIEEGKPDVLYCGTVDALAWVKSISPQGQIAGEASLYAWNQEAVSFWEKELDSISIPLELDSKEIRELCTAVREACAEEKGKILHSEDTAECAEWPSRRGVLEVPVYGRTPFMVSANCIKLSSGRCDKNRKRYTELTDRMGNIFPVYTNCDHCYNIIYNCLPTSYHENIWMLLQDGIRAFRIEFTTEDGDAAGEVLKTFQDILASELQGKNGKGKRSEKDKRNDVRKSGIKRGKSGSKSAGSDMPEIKKGKIAGMEVTQGRFRRPVE